MIVPLAVGNENNTNFPSLMNERNIEKDIYSICSAFFLLSTVVLWVWQKVVFFCFFLQTVVTFSKHKKFQKGLLVDQYKLNQLYD